LCFLAELLPLVFGFAYSHSLVLMIIFRPLKKKGKTNAGESKKEVKKETSKRLVNVVD